ncbi:MAG: hypothetical protein HY878_06985 [Deltaproteobacteria bacterium]|nr:hypothetical protein [Deltaproteobacteria bacterium]
MVIVITDTPEDSREIRDFFAANGLKVRTVPIEGFEEGLKGKVDLIVYDTYQLRPTDIENIHLAERAHIPILLITAYPDDKDKEEVSKLWRGGLIKGYLLKPVSHEMLAGFLSSTKSLCISYQPEGAMR